MQTLAQRFAISEVSGSEPVDSARDLRLSPRIRQPSQPIVEHIFPGAAHVVADLDYVFHCNL